MFNDPIHGFITVPKGIILELIDHPYVQRLRRIKQMGLGYLVFPAAEHSRFSHALGAMELAQRTLNHLREKDTTISPAEYEILSSTRITTVIQVSRVQSRSSINVGQELFISILHYVSLLYVLGI